MNDDSATGDRTASTDLATADFDLPAQRSLQARSWLSLGMVVLVFIAGAIVGVAGTRAMQGPRAIRTLDEIPARVAERMQRDLDLSGEQRDRLEQIVRAHQGDVRRIRAQIAPQMRAEIRRIIDEMSAVLSPEQAERWREHAERRLNLLVPSTEHDPTEPASP
jgi:hypothetical protein